MLNHHLFNPAAYARRPSKFDKVIHNSKLWCKVVFLEGATLLLKMRWAFVLRYLYFFMLTRHARQRREEHFENDSENYDNNLLPHLVSLLALSLPS